MVLRPDNSVPEPPAEAVPRPKKRLITPEMRAASRANSQKSTGPKTAAGRAAVAVNAMRHGQTCKTLLFLDDEDPAQFWEEVDRWVRERGAKTSDEIALVETAVYSRWTRRRAQNAPVWATKQVIDDFSNDYNDRKIKEVTQSIKELATEPVISVSKLLNSTQGCAFLINQFQLLGKRLTTHTAFEVSQRAYAIHLAGFRPKDLFIDPRVMEINRCYFGALRGVGGFTAAIAASALMDDRPEEMTLMEFERRLEPMVSNLPTIAEGHAQLKRFVANTIETLLERMELIELREEKEKKAAIGKAQSDISTEGERRARYMTMSDRTMFSSLGLLLKLKKDRKESRDADSEEDDRTPDREPVQAPAPAPRSEPVPVPASNSVPAASGSVESYQPEPKRAFAPPPRKPAPVAAHPANDGAQNKAEPTQVAVEAMVKNVSPTRPAAGHDAPVHLSAEDDLATRAHYGHSLAKLEAYLKERAEIEPSGPLPDP
jgi:hypothetical protein